MNFQSFFLSLIFLIQVLMGIYLILLWKKVEKKFGIHGNPKPPLTEEMRFFESRFQNLFDSLRNLIESQNILISTLTGEQGFIKLSGLQSAEAIVKQDTETNQSSSQSNVIPRFNIGDPEKKLEQLLNDSEFLKSTWERMNGPFSKCSAEIAKYLVDHGIPESIIEPYPNDVGDHTQHWEFLIVQVKGEAANRKRFVVPQNYIPYEPLLHSNLFEIKGGNDSLEARIAELHQCAILSSMGSLKNATDLSNVIKKGKVSLG